RGRGCPRGRAARDVIAGRLPADLAERARHRAVAGLDRPGVVAGAAARRPARLVVRAIANPIAPALDDDAGVQSRALRGPNADSVAVAFACSDRLSHAQPLRLAEPQPDSHVASVL